ncbi:YicC family protein [Legionella taurinensis]|uniref:YicC family protein n=1 Tax=Legionella taurinensis TaxID=70611 RepID=A0A3A5L7B5_9GAMM|nr:YicC/YloC family endoribonuclease [Legionella taurinensis]MDX1836416.1 YicC/YloC family endoribonuclease [Legionella taurinensis]PUT43112.1 YicC family protein [Legionella taurinensis]PUT45071.1 YicC family protein [Legionella taurinensis]PUT45667.1 YicC family protein [Legionella taurinensis]PUT49436.1 YicC family protein [Legionella taurinensis]
MTQSMTAFARAQAQVEATTLCWEIRSVNHRYQEISFRLPEIFRFLENDLRHVLRQQCSRGKFECQLKLTESDTQAQSIAINQALLDSLLAVGNQLAAQKHLANDLTLASLLNWPGVVQVAQPDAENLATQVKQLFQQAVTALTTARMAEGQALEHYLQLRVKKMQDEVDKARMAVSVSLDDARDKLLTRLHALQLDVDHGRVEQEIALLLTRMDVSEELDRLTTHLLEVARVLGNTEASGRRLDFLMQELNREANTLGSKSDSIALTQCAIEMKVLIEQMREQIQNIE